MPRFSVLPLYFLIHLSYFCNAASPTFDSVVVNSTVNVVPSDSLGSVAPVFESTAVCVNNNQHPTWGPTLQLFDFSSCGEALEMVTKKLENDLYKSFVFYSRRAYPSGHDGWPLAQGAGSGESKDASKLARQGKLKDHI